MTQPAVIADFKAQFNRDFPYGTGLDTVRDADITSAFNSADLIFNAALWSQTEVKIAYLYVAAHVLFLNLQASGGLNLNGGQGAEAYGGGNIQQKSVGQVSVSYQLPPSLADNALLNQFMQSRYGQFYLQLLVPRLVGGGYVVGGWRDVC